MRRHRRLKLNFGRLALTFLLLCLIIYTCYHALWNSSGRLLTTPARQISDTRLIGGEAWLFRDETLLTSHEAGLVNSVAVSGSKVGKNTVLTEVWSDGSVDGLGERQTKLDLINRTVSVLESGILPSGTPLSNAEGYRNDAATTVTEIRRAIRDGNWEALSKLEDELLISLNRYGALTGKADAINEVLERAKAERDAMLVGNKTELINSESSAYYYGLSEVDGYETVFTETALSELSAESFAMLKASEPKTGDGFVAGKLCYGYSWHVAVEFSDACEDLFLIGGFYQVSFPENDGATVEMICERLLQNDNGGTVAVLRSDVTPSDFRFLRSQRAEITVGYMEGIYIPKQAYVSLDGVDGVYVFDESTVRFRRISISYVGDGYLIASLVDGDPDHEIPYLGLNDLMILSGRKLYDGKVYR